MQIRLWEWQIDHIKCNKGCSGAAILRHAVKRYRRGDFADCSSVVQNTEMKIKGKKVPQNKWQLVGYSIKHRFGIPDAVLRDILTWHWQTPDKVLIEQCNKEIKRLDSQIKEMLKAYTGNDYLLEENK